MACFNPLTGFVLINKFTETGKKKIVFKENEVKNRPYMPINIPCGQCIGCRIAKSKEWAVRCTHEASMFSRNSFITLTYDDDTINELGSLDKRDFQLFMKRLRKRFKGYEAVKNNKGRITYPIRYFHCGEYGERLCRPHHHACLFNFDFDDKEYFKEKNGYNWYISESLAELWPHGYHTIGDVTYESASYIARYVTKKMNGSKAKEHYTKVNPFTGEIITLQPEFITMSRKPGIGSEWFKKFSEDIFPKDFTTIEGRIVQTPKYYDKMFEVVDPQAFEKIKRKRLERSIENAENKTMQRLITRHKVQKGKTKNSKREL